MLINAHDGVVEQKRGFLDTWTALSARGPVSAMTTTGKQFDSLATVTGDGRKAIVFKRNGLESARAYECCWGHYYNCNRTRFGMYSKALDDVL
jgi:hypothetical protein